MTPPDSTPLVEDSFENRLRNTPRRPAPIEWREAILTTATATAARRFQLSPTPRVARTGETLQSLWGLLAGRIPVGWVGFAAVWALIFTSGQFDSWLNGAPLLSRSSSAIALRVVDFGKYRTELLRVAELLPETGPEERTPPPPHSPPTLRPHSQRDSLPQPFGGIRRPSDLLPA